jgi:hypothetical protein
MDPQNCTVTWDPNRCCRLHHRFTLSATIFDEEERRDLVFLMVETQLWASIWASEMKN